MNIHSPEEFEAAYRKYGEAIYRFCYWQTRDGILAQDITSAVFEKAWRSRRSFKGGSVQAWLYRIARNLLVDHWRKKKDLLMDDMPGVAEQLEGPSGAVDYDREMMLWRMSQSLDTLPPELKSVVVLRFIEGLSAREVGEMLGLSEGNVRVMQFRALRKLRKYLES